MKKTILSILLGSLFFLGSFTDVKAQGTFDYIVDTIFALNCGSLLGGCHNPGNSNGLVLVDTPKSYIYNTLLNDSVVLPTPRMDGLKRVDPGNPANSLLLRKLVCLDGPEPPLPIPYGTCMPGEIDQTDTVSQAGGLLDVDDINLIRAWIAADAPDTGIVVVPGIDLVLVDLDNSFKVFPNPFSGSINIAYTLPRTMHVKLELLNMLGERKTLFVDKKQQSGEHSLEYDAEVDVLPQSVYILNFYVDEYFISRKVVQIR